MAKVIIHATVTLDGFMADVNGGVDWMYGFPVAPEDEAVVGRIVQELGAVVGGANKTQTIEDGEVPYGGMSKIPVYLMTHSAHEPSRRTASPPPSLSMTSRRPLNPPNRRRGTSGSACWEASFETMPRTRGSSMRSSCSRADVLGEGSRSSPV